ncbi:hypothetical protein [Herbaspirillum sp. SJZ107]|uniref:hypothetical protein n=1 Tax=Herbaspirillum sp. SJZ107 TaxID=2572881 RepID=UPI001152FDA2|nr:hypothetical protein [Herbaspirillum sp. SJZ107]TQK03506.1 hypothetical protein FBX97_5078 [Herbaspirillum sp. SJZ107]
MEKESKPSGGVPTSGIIAIVMLTVGVLFIRTVPLEATRLPVSEPKIQQASAGQDMDARLWQDPFGAVARAREEARKRDPKKAEASDSERQPEKILGEMKDGDRKAVVLAVMLQGGPYSEDIETRRRVRYAVLAGLDASGQVPIDAEHLGYFFPKGPDKSGFVPYEWFQSKKEKAGDHAPRVLVLWLDGNAFKDKPLEEMRTLVGQIKPRDRLASWRVLGPATSGGLSAMVKELDDIPDVQPSGDPEQAEVPTLYFYSAVPTAPDTRIAPELPSGQSLPSLFDKKGVKLVRTIGDDRQLANALIRELRLRGLHAGRRRTEQDATCELGKDKPQVPSHVAIISEWDTLYGRALGDAFLTHADADGFCIHSASYVRGLDGEQPPAAGTGASPAKAGPATAGTEDKYDSRQLDGTYLEIAEGQSQFDYLRRLAKRLTDIDQEIGESSPDGMGLRAIGVLGSDVHDKLVVLQALQPQFPNAIFFTTDLDARFLHPREKAWTRNLVVASHFNLRLAETMQPDMPSFRDAYQTSNFLATRLAMDDALRAEAVAVATGAGKPPPGEPTSQETIRAWFTEPRLFEIGRTRPFDFSSGPPAAPAADREPGSGCTGPDWKLCGASIHPEPSDLYPHLRLFTLWFVASLLILMLWLPPVLASRKLRRRLRGVLLAGSLAQRIWRWQAAALVLALAHLGLPLLLAHYWEPFAIWLTHEGKPLVALEGISLWPTEAIRLVTLLLCVYLIYSGWAALTENLDDILKRFNLREMRMDLVDKQRKADRHLPRWLRFVNMFSLRLILPRDVSHGSPNEPFWRRYIVQNRISARATRTTACVLLAGLASWCLAQALHSPWFVPQRGELSLTVHQWLHSLMFVAIYFLLFFVVDATTFCVSFVRGLTASRVVNWPSDTLRRFEKELQIPGVYLNKWINLQFIAMRTKCVSRLIYFPFIVLSLFLMSRNPFFDHWTMSGTGVALMVLGAGVALACALALRYAAEAARQDAIQDLSDEIMRASGGEPAPSWRGMPAAPPVNRSRPASGPKPAQLKLLLERMEQLHEGAFAPFWQQPLLKAFLLPFATLGGTSILDYMALANL